MTGQVMRLSALLEGAGVRPLAVIGADPEIRGAHLDSRRIERGDLFFAIRGFQADGEKFAPEAVRRGAPAVVAASPRPDWVGPEIAWVQVEEPRVAAGLLSREYFGRPDEALTLVGITGTNGKTTVSYLVEAIARSAGRRVGRIGTVGLAFDGVEQAGERTTPEAPDFYLTLARMRDAAIDLVAMEVSSHALALARVEGARFAAAAFLNLSRDHLDFHVDEERYFEAKARLFTSLTAQQHAVLPFESPYRERLAQRTAARVITFGRDAQADVRVRDERCGLDGSSAVLDTPAGTLALRTPLLGAFNMDNVAAAAACDPVYPESVRKGTMCKSMPMKPRLPSPKTRISIQSVGVRTTWRLVQRRPSTAARCAATALPDAAATYPPSGSSP